MHCSRLNVEKPCLLVGTLNQVQLRSHGLHRSQAIRVAPYACIAVQLHRQHAGPEVKHNCMFDASFTTSYKITSVRIYKSVSSGIDHIELPSLFKLKLVVRGIKIIIEKHHLNSKYLQKYCIKNFTQISISHPTWSNNCVRLNMKRIQA